MISRENYEIWFMDYLDGKLSPDEIEVLNAFFSLNPDLKKEFEEIRSITLLPEKVLFVRKENMLKDEAAIINISSADYLLVKQMEEGLSADEEKQLALLINDDGSLIHRAEAYQKMRLQAAPVVFPRTNALLQRRFSLVLVFRRVAAAAAVLLLFFAGWQWFNNPSQGKVELLTIMQPNKLPLLRPETDFALPNTKELKEQETGNQREATRTSISSRSNEAKPAAIVRDEKAQVPLRPLEPRQLVSLSSPNGVPNAFELGLNSMMPLFLKLNNQNQMLAQTTTDSTSNPKDNILTRGLQLIDKVTGELIQFNKIYNEEGTYVAYHLQTPVFKIESKLDKSAKN